MALAFERLIEPEAAQPVRREIDSREAQLNIAVIFTSVESTLNALRKAGAMASSLGARITLVVPQVVPFPAPLESPPVLLDWNEKRFQVIASQSPVETTVKIYLCRDRLETLTSILPARSIVVVGARKRWLPTSEARLAHKLRKAGHEVVLAEVERSHA